MRTSASGHEPRSWPSFATDDRAVSRVDNRDPFRAKAPSRNGQGNDEGDRVGGKAPLSSSSSPDGGEPFTLTLDPGTYTVEWFGVHDRETAGADQTTVTEGSARFTPPFSEGPTVLYLKKVPVPSA
jgi:hypothetical protein